MFRSVAVAPMVLLLATAAALGQPRSDPGQYAPPARAQESGRQIFDAICAQCHTVQPPARLAPPMSHIARHYLTEIPDADQAAERIAAWVRQPAQDRSLLDAHAIDMWGVMPPVELADDQVRAVARYVVSLADSAVGGMGMGRGMMRRDTTGMTGGMGMGRGMMRRDTTGMTGGMGMGRGMMRRDTTGMMGRMGTGRGMMRRGAMGTDTPARPLRFREG